MRLSSYFFSIVGVSMALSMAAGCATDPPDGNGGAGGDAGASAGGAGGSAGGTGGSMSGSSSGTMSGSSSGTMSSSSSSSSSGSMGNAEPPAMNGMTAAHNVVRAGVMPAPATPMPPLEWSSEVAAVAQAHADKCVFQHSSSPYGENIYAATGGKTPQAVVDSWASEESSYDYGTNSCSNVCGHYTQIVWAKSLRLGCGVTQCTKNSPFGGGSWEFWVCNYDPPGNYVGQKPY